MMGKYLFNPLPLLVLQVGYADFVAEDWAEVSKLYCERRERSGLGAYAFPPGRVLLCDVPFGMVGYDGTIWPTRQTGPDARLIYDNRAMGT